MQLLQEIHDPMFAQKQLKVVVLRLDLLHPVTGGNKYFKLKYNLQAAKERSYKTVLSFGGAYSNHIAALAAAAHEQHLRSIGVIRGDELNEESNATLKTAAELGMQLHFVDREAYANKNDPAFLQKLQREYGDFSLIPEGGSNALAVKGCMEIVSWITAPFDYVLTACGTGGTIAGLSLSLEPHQKAIGIPVLKGAAFLEKEIHQLQEAYFDTYGQPALYKAPQLFYKYHFGGYAKTDADLQKFQNDFREQTSIPLDPVYTAKCFYALYDLARNDYFTAGQTVVILHTGGLQGIPN